MRLVFRHITEGFFIAFRALRANPVRSILTTLGIIIGVLTVILMITIVQGLNRSFKEQISFLGSGLLYINKMPWIISDDYFLYRNRPDITVAEFKVVRSQSRLASTVAVEIATGKTVKYKEKSLSRVSVSGVSANYLQVISTFPKYGRFLNEIDETHNRSVVVIGCEVADELFGKENPIGRRISISGYKYRVIGVLEKQGEFFGHSMDKVAMIPYGAMLKDFGRHHWTSILVNVRNAQQIDELEYELKGIMRRARGLTAGQKDNFAINRQSQLLNLYNQVTSGVYTVGLVIGGISLIVGGIGIMNIMLVSVTERTKEIGLRKAIGAKRINIVWQFLVESAAICSLGGAIGIGLAYVLGKVIEKYLPTSMPFWVAILGLGFSALVGIFFGLWPALKAAKLNPIEALRYE
jgi:putative ABC transport system permease protein